MRNVITILAQTKCLNIVIKRGVITEKRIARSSPPTKSPLCSVEPNLGADESSGGVEGPLSSGVCIGLHWVGEFSSSSFGQSFTVTLHL